jgi:hypothetical protein
VYCAGSVLELLSASSVSAVSQDSKVLRFLWFPLSITLASAKSITWSWVHACFATFDPFLLCSTFLTCSDFFVFREPNQSINQLWKSTNTHTNIQYDFYNSTKEVLKDFRSEHEDKLKNQLTCQGSFFSNVTKFSLSHLNKVWSTAQSKLPKNIYNFTIRYINNSLPTRKNLSRWGLSSSSECSFCLGPESLLHVVAGCQCYLDRFTWRHNSILNFFANTLQTVNGSALYADVPGFKSPWIITVRIARICCYHLISDQESNYDKVKFVNVSISSLGVFGQSTNTLTDMLKELMFDEQQIKYIKKKIIALCIRTSYYVFCQRNNDWTSTELLKFWTILNTLFL